MMGLPKILAIYLPQFHQTPDNDRWWGEGFTDWNTVKSASVYFDGHIQPKKPMDGFYYDLLDKETMKKQAEWAKEYGIDGFCFYHYYFKDGKKELEFPAENLLKWKDIDMPFCFNWASEPWVRSWSRIAGNVWTEKYDARGANSKSGILVGQDYGKEEDWEKHFYYLLPFFSDTRYLRIDDKPVFIFYSPDEIRCLKKMVEYWRSLAEKEGLKDIYFIGARMSGYSDCLDAALVYEPRHAINRLNEKNKLGIRQGVRCYDYQNIWNECLSATAVSGMKTFYSGVVDYDDTPRRGEMGECFTDVDSNIFESGLINLIEKSAVNENEFVFLNAWNEWGEGMYLEPDSLHEFMMLKAVKAAKEKFNISEVTKRKGLVVEKNNERSFEAERNAKKYKELFEIVDRWLFLEQENSICLKEYLSKRGFGNFAIYGMASLGKHLLLQARKESIEPLFGIDRYVGQFGETFKIYRPEDNFPETDCIIVTAYDYEDICEKLKSKIESEIEIIYLGDMLCEMQS